MSSTTVISSTSDPLPEDLLAQHGLAFLPDFLKDDEEAESARAVVEALLGRFLLVSKTKKKHNAFRRQIAPAISLALAYLMERAMLYMETTKDNEVYGFAVRMQRIILSFSENASVKSLLDLYGLETTPGELLEQPTPVKLLPELRAAIQTSEIKTNDNLNSPNKDLTRYEMRLQLASLQWQAIKIFMRWKVERDKKEYFVMELASVMEQSARIDKELRRVKSALSARATDSQ